MDNSLFFISIILLYILFFIIFFYYLLSYKSELIQYRVIKTPIYDESSPDNLINKLKKKYEPTCEEMCDKKICCEYKNQMRKYNLCKECGKKFQCYNDNKGICEYCLNFNNCDEIYGCNNSEPIKPNKNFCVRCWNN